ncbi:MAG: DUF4105 domain-containing protein [Bdellovibrionales bacterium]|jgi:hypothetical protein|nr:DUF4105 domain-containing protein [Bdellovibrionales bacterium]
MNNVIIGICLLFSFVAQSNEKYSRRISKKILQAQVTSTQLNIYEQNAIKLQKLKKRFKKDQIIGIELIIAAPTNTSIESKWGHALLRFVDNSRSAGNDFVLGFVADLNTYGIKYLKGIFGGYAVYPELKSLRDYHQMYIKEQDRSLQRFIIPSNKDIQLRLFNSISDYLLKYHSIQNENYKNQLVKMESKANRKNRKGKYILNPIIDPFTARKLGYTLNDPKTGRIKKVYPVKLKNKRSNKKFKTPYTFLKRNCSGAIIDLFRSIGFEFSSTISLKKTIPVKLPIFLAQNNIIQLSPEEIPPISLLLKKIETTLNIRLNDKVNQKLDDYLETQIKNNLKLLNRNELLILVDNFYFSDSVRESIIKELSIYRDRPNYDLFYNIISFNNILYKLCDKLSCVADQLALNPTLVTHKLKRKLPQHDYSKSFRFYHNNLHQLSQ